MTINIRSFDLNQFADLAALRFHRRGRVTMRLDRFRFSPPKGRRGASSPQRRAPPRSIGALETRDNGAARR
jgi:hypothetical protein